MVKFYSFFYDRPRGAYRVLFSDNITDRMAGSFELFNRMLGNFGVKRGEVSADGLVSIDLTSCIGMGDQGPAMLINNLTLVAARRAAHRQDQRTDKGAHAARSLAGRVLPR